MFSREIAEQYIVVEVAIYPEGGVPFDVQSSDFALRVGQRMGRADRPVDVAPWLEYQRSNDPVYGRPQGVGTYTGVGVEVPGRADPPPDPRVDSRTVYDKIQRFALMTGATNSAVAGYR